MAIVQQYLFGSNHEFYAIVVSISDGSGGYGNLWRTAHAITDDYLYVNGVSKSTYSGVSSGMCAIKIELKSGNVIWQKEISSWYIGPTPNAIDADSSGNVYISGMTNSIMTPGANSTVLLLKYNSSGVEQWRRGIGHTNPNPGTTHSSGWYVYTEYTSSVDIHCDGTTKIIKFGDDEVDGSSGLAVDNRNAYWIEISDAGAIGNEYTYKRNSSNSGGWRQNNYDTFAGYTKDSSGNVYACGIEEGPEAYYDAGSQKTIFIKLNSSGVIQWQKEFRYIDTSRAQSGATGGGAPANTNGSITRVDKPAVDSSGNMYVTANTIRGKGNGNMRIPHFFKIDSSGTLQWIRQLSDNPIAFTFDKGFKGCAVDRDTGDPYTVSRQELAGDWGNSSSSIAKWCYVITKWNSSGNMQWQRVLVGHNTSQQYSRMEFMGSDHSGTGHRRNAKFDFVDRGILFFARIYDGSASHVMYLKFPVDTYLVGDWELPYNNGSGTFKLYIRDMSTGLVSTSVSSYAYYRNANKTRFNGCSGDNGPYTQSDFATQYNTNPVNSNNGSALPTSNNTAYPFSGARFGIHNE